MLKAERPDRSNPEMLKAESGNAEGKSGKGKASSNAETLKCCPVK